MVLGVAVAVLAGVVAIGVRTGADGGGKPDAAAAGPVTSSPASTSDNDENVTEPTRSTTTAPADVSPEPTTTSPADPGDDEGPLDPRFSTCEKANNAGYGPYHRDDPEYAWYRDRDEDGIVCEQ